MLSVGDSVVKGPDTLMGDDGTAGFMEGHRSILLLANYLFTHDTVRTFKGF